MVYTILIFGRRKEGTTFEAFKDHYDNRHVPLLKRLLGDKFPQTHTRYYVDSDSNKDVFMGKSPNFPNDVVTVITYADRAAKDASLACWADAEFADAVAKDEAVFADRSSLFMVDVGEDSSFTTTKDA